MPRLNNNIFLDTPQIEDPLVIGAVGVVNVGVFTGAFTGEVAKVGAIGALIGATTEVGAVGVETGATTEFGEVGVITGPSTGVGVAGVVAGTSMEVGAVGVVTGAAGDVGAENPSQVPTVTAVLVILSISKSPKKRNGPTNHFYCSYRS
jgi:hypothetical protein